jgi:predicted hotdog family 3-hydroxylacyl-ACP dehydratase
VSQIGEMNLYNQLLARVQECRFMSRSTAEEMLQVAYARPFPQPNTEVYIRTVAPDFRKLTYIIKRESESRYNNVCFSKLLSCLHVDVLLQVFATILLERRVIFCSSQLSVLSSCMSTIVALLYPFEWQHTFITVLPSMLIDVVDAPTPFIIGILSTVKPQLDDHQLSEVLLVNLDNGYVEMRIGDESRIIPRKIQKALCAAINDDSDSGGAAQCLNSAVPVQANDATVAEAFLRMFVETCGHYDGYITVQQNGEKIFQRELFVKVVSSRSIRMFLEWFTMTQMFEVFITDKLKDDCVPGQFEQRISEYREEMDHMANTFRDNMKVFRRKFVGFFRDYGEKIKKSFQKGVFV